MAEPQSPMDEAFAQLNALIDSTYRKERKDNAVVLDVWSTLCGVRDRFAAAWTREQKSVAALKKALREACIETCHECDDNAHAETGRHDCGRFRGDCFVQRWRELVGLHGGRLCE